VLVTRLTKKATRGAPNFPIRHIPSNVKQHKNFKPHTMLSTIYVTCLLASGTSTLLPIVSPNPRVHTDRDPFPVANVVIALLLLSCSCLRLTCRDHNGGLSDAARTASSKMIQLKSSSTDPSSGVHPGGGRSTDPSSGVHPGGGRSTDPSSGATRGGRSSTDPCARC
ncbi:hypothetical protein PSTT_16227, partial [Puccinia striiformis]